MDGHLEITTNSDSHVFVKRTPKSGEELTELTVCLQMVCFQMRPESSAGWSGPLKAPEQGELRLSAGGTLCLKTVTGQRKEY